MAMRTITPLLTRHFVRRCLAVIGLTLLVHIPMQAAWVIVAHRLSPQTSIADLIAASAIVMFATSVPISLAGWGMREMSSVVGLGAIGVSGHAALTTAVVIGIGSLLVVGIIAAVSLPDAHGKKHVSNAQPSNSVDYYRVLAWVLPFSAATLVLFQIHVPIRSGLINVNLADPIAILGGVMFILSAARNRQLPQWRLPNINLAIVIGTVVLSRFATPGRKSVRMDNLGSLEPLRGMVRHFKLWSNRSTCSSTKAAKRAFACCSLPLSGPLPRLPVLKPCSSL